VVKKYLSYLLFGICILVCANAEVVSAHEVELTNTNVEVLQKEEFTYKPYETATYELTYEVLSEGIMITGYIGSAEGNLVLPDSINGVDVIEFKNRAFAMCDGFTGELKLPKSLKSMGYEVFCGCSGLTGDLVIPESLTVISSGAFDSCSGLDGDLVLHDMVTTIESNAFYGCTGFSGNLVLPKGVTKIGDGAFYECTGFSGDLVLPEGLKELGLTAFALCTGFDGDLILPASLEKTGSMAFSMCSGFNGNLVLSEGVKVIEPLTFGYCSGFSGNLVLPKSLEEVSASAFWGCSGFSGELVIPEGLKVIGYSAFRECTGFNGDLVIPQSVTTINDYAFLGCSGMSRDAYISSNTTSIGPDAFLFNVVETEDITVQKHQANTIYVIKGSYAEGYAKENYYNIGYWSGDMSFPFGDLPDDTTNWKYTSAKYVYENDIMSGVSRAKFAPDMTMNRAMFVQLLYNKEKNPEVVYESKFTDVPQDAWYSAAVIWAVNNGITSGVDESLFGSDMSITREQIATLLYDFAKMKGQDVTGNASIDSFPDKGNVSEWAETAMKWAVAEGVMSGRKVGESVLLAPKDTATRAECATMIYNYCMAYEK